MLTIIDEAGRKCLARVVACQLNHEDMLAALADLTGFLLGLVQRVWNDAEAAAVAVAVAEANKLVTQLA